MFFLQETSFLSRSTISKAVSYCMSVGPPSVREECAERNTESTEAEWSANVVYNGKSVTHEKKKIT